MAMSSDTADKGFLMALESSCDDSSAAIVDLQKKCLIDALTFSQDVHALFGGVVPELASRDHLKKIPVLIDRILKKNAIGLSDIGYIACTNRPGLIGSLLIGLMAAKTLGYLLNIPFVGVNHLHSHIFADFWNYKANFPFLAMVISGGHSDMFLVEDYTHIKRIGMTVDDAAGEILDKIAKELNLGYPGGPAIEKYAKTHENKNDTFKLPIPMRLKDNYNMSFSGLKTACYLLLKEEKTKGTLNERIISKASYSLLLTISESIILKSRKALKDYGFDHIVIGGGVMRNQIIREILKTRFAEDGINLHIPPPEYCTDNAAMVAYLGMIYCERGMSDHICLNAYASYD